ncbi:OmpA family protein [Reichenbachiella sp. MALMAid0571]|uniref:OmpA family protein n=1 Tax=Reichenbachiella sp. MALMAid0571 TaxID=3143939 RepID=UPI0032DFDBCA
MKKLLIAVLFFVTYATVSAQFVDDKNWLVVTADNNQIGSLFQKPIKDLLKINKPSFSIGVEHYMTENFNISGKVSMGKVYDSRYSNQGEPNFLMANFTEVEASGIFKLNNVIMPNEQKFTPFLELGLALANFNGNENDKVNGVSVKVPMAVGVRYRLNENMQLVAKIGNHATTSTNYRRLSLGFSFSLKGKLDADKDGVYDKDDECPSDFGPISNNGCPYPDTDQDGVIDIDDECPLIVGNLKGCPDMDNDGIPDHKDKCPEIFGLSQHDGCPDTDGDGIIDSEDPCPNVMGAVNGCPQTDFISQIHFDFNSSIINSNYYAELNKLVKALIGQEGMKVVLLGYTDNVGEKKTNITLSKRRAENVRAYLINGGLSINQITINAFGEKYSIADNSTEEGRAKNRRVEITISE